MHHALVLLANCGQVQTRLNHGHDTGELGTEFCKGHIPTQSVPSAKSYVGGGLYILGGISPKVSAVVDLPATSQVT